MDIKFKKIGELPILYPFDQPCDVDVYYGKWKRGVPFEIRVDVKNPAVEGDFYFEPIIWDEQSKSYVLKSREVKYGRRH